MRAAKDRKRSVCLSRRIPGGAPLPVRLDQRGSECRKASSAQAAHRIVRYLASVMNSADFVGVHSVHSFFIPTVWVGYTIGTFRKFELGSVGSDGCLWLVEKYVQLA